MGKPKCVLVASGDDVMKRVLTAVLEEAGYEVRTSSGAHEALLQTSAYRPHAVVVTATLGDGDGYRVSRTIKTRHWQGQPFLPPKVFLLADHKIEHDADVEQMFRDFAKADAVLDMPLDMGLLLDRIVATIGRSGKPMEPTPRSRRSALWRRAGRLA